MKVSRGDAERFALAEESSSAPRAREIPFSALSASPREIRVADWRSLVGKPFVDGGRAAAGYDCWGLVMAAHPEALPDFACLPAERRLGQALAEAERESRRWRRLDGPGEDAVALMAARPPHAGIVKAGGVLHAVRGAGAVWLSLARAKAEWPGIRFYEFIP